MGRVLSREIPIFQGADVVGRYGKQYRMYRNREIYSDPARSETLSTYGSIFRGNRAKKWYYSHKSPDIREIKRFFPLIIVRTKKDSCDKEEIMLKGIQWKLIIFVFFVQFLLAVSVRADDGPVEPKEPAPLFSISVTPSSVTCPTTFFGGTSTCESIRVTNTGNVAVELLVKVNNYAFSVEQPIIPLSAGDITNLGVEFRPLPYTTGEVRGKVIITAYKDTQFQSHEVELTGTSYFLIIIAVFVIAFFAWYLLRRMRG